MHTPRGCGKVNLFTSLKSLGEGRTAISHRPRREQGKETDQLGVSVVRGWAWEEGSQGGYGLCGLNQHQKREQAFIAACPDGGRRGDREGMRLKAISSPISNGVSLLLQR